MALPRYASRRCQIIIQGTSHLSRTSRTRSMGATFFRRIPRRGSTINSIGDNHQGQATQFPNSVGSIRRATELNKGIE